MNIGIDLDDTIAETAKGFFYYGSKFNQERNINHKIQKKEWDFDKAFGWNEEHIEDFFKTYLEKLFTGLDPKQDAVDIINLLKREGHKIVVITARSVEHIKNAYEICDNWLKEHNIMVDKIVINGNDKAEKCKENDIDIFIDDSIYHCENVYNKLKIPVLLMNSWYNEKQEVNNIKRVFNWHEIYSEIKKINLK